jgi:hypothetical protein
VRLCVCLVYIHTYSYFSFVVLFKESLEFLIPISFIGELRWLHWKNQQSNRWSQHQKKHSHSFKQPKTTKTTTKITVVCLCWANFRRLCTLSLFIVSVTWLSFRCVLCFFSFIVVWVFNTLLLCLLIERRRRILQFFSFTVVCVCVSRVIILALCFLSFIVV